MKFTQVVMAFAVSFGVLMASREGMSTDATNSYFSFADTSCGKFVVARRSHTDKVYGWYLAGYLTALNEELPDTYNLVGSADLSGAMLWIENWCSKNPQDALSDAAAALVREMYPKRQKVAPE